MKALKSYFSLQFVENRFRDVVSGDMVAYYKDCFGDIYMKDSRWSLFSVKVSTKTRN